MDIEFILKDNFKKHAALIQKYPPQSAKKYLPDWYKSVKITRDRTNTDHYFDDKNKHAKKCPAIKNLINEGVVLRAWADIYFRWDSDTFEYDMPIRQAGDAPLQHYLDPHASFQTQQMDINIEQRVGALKLTSPFWFKVPKGYSLYYTDPFYMFRKNVRFLPGIVENDIWYETNFPFEFYEPLKGKGSYTIKAGEPLLHIVPVLQSENHNVIVREETVKDKQELEKQKALRFHRQNWFDIYDN